MVANSRAKTNNETGALPFYTHKFARERSSLVYAPQGYTGESFSTADRRADRLTHCSLTTDGFVKVIAEKNTDKILGCHIISNVAGEILAEA